MENSIDKLKEQLKQHKDYTNVRMTRGKCPMSGNMRKQLRFHFQGRKGYALQEMETPFGLSQFYIIDRGTVIDISPEVPPASRLTKILKGDPTAEYMQ